MRSEVTHARMEGMVKRGLLPKRTEAMEWQVPKQEVVSSPSDGYVFFFSHLHERGLGVPPH